MVLVLMGITASGKTTVGQALAQTLEWIFADADDYHSAGNRDKMRDNIPLTDQDRLPWLLELHELIADWEENGINGVLACSALKQQYREMLAEEIAVEDIRFIYLHGSRELIEERGRQRHHAFASAEMIDSQLQALEPPANAITVEIGQDEASAKSVDAIVQEILTTLGIRTAEQFHAEE